MIKNQIVLLFIFLFLFISHNNIIAQNWDIEPIRNNWGDITGERLVQRVTGTARISGHDPVGIYLVYIHPTRQEFENRGGTSNGVFSAMMGIGTNIHIVSETEKGRMHPASTRLNEPITISLRSGEITRTFRGITNASESSWNRVVFTISDSGLRDLLRGHGQWDVLIEGGRWHIRTIISGNLPRR